MSRAERTGSVVSLMMMDLQGFKTINDRLGHPVGDTVLVKTAKVIRDSLRAVDAGCRYGGDEFVAVLPNTTLMGSLAVAERIRQRVAKIQLPRRIGLTMGLHYGVATFPSDGRTSDFLIRTCDQRLYDCRRYNSDPRSRRHPRFAVQGLGLRLARGGVARQREFEVKDIGYGGLAFIYPSSRAPTHLEGETSRVRVRHPPRDDEAGQREAAQRRALARGLRLRPLGDELEHDRAESDVVDRGSAPASRRLRARRHRRWGLPRRQRLLAVAVAALAARSSSAWPMRAACAFAPRSTYRGAGAGPGAAWLTGGVRSPAGAAAHPSRPRFHGRRRALPGLRDRGRPARARERLARNHGPALAALARVFGPGRAGRAGLALPSRARPPIAGRACVGDRGPSASPALPFMPPAAAHARCDPAPILRAGGRARPRAGPARGDPPRPALAHQRHQGLRGPHRGARGGRAAGGRAPPQPRLRDRPHDAARGRAWAERRLPFPGRSTSCRSGRAVSRYRETTARRSASRCRRSRAGRGARPVALQRVFRNVLDNALQYTRGRHVRIRLWADLHAHVVVSDTGVGMSAEEASARSTCRTGDVGPRHCGRAGADPA